LKGERNGIYRTMGEIEGLYSAMGGRDRIYRAMGEGDTIIEQKVRENECVMRLLRGGIYSANGSSLNTF